MYTLCSIALSLCQLVAFCESTNHIICYESQKVLLPHDECMAFKYIAYIAPKSNAHTMYINVNINTHFDAILAHMQ
jgi:hypothetical protein